MRVDGGAQHKTTEEEEEEEEEEPGELHMKLTAIMHLSVTRYLSFCLFSLFVMTFIKRCS